MSNLSGEAATVVMEINTGLPLRKLAAQIDRLALSADVKSLLMDLARITMKVGEVVLQIGRKIISVAFDIIARFPNTIFGIVIGVAVALLVGSIPLLGGLLTPFAMPLLLAFGLTKGAIADMANEGWTSRIRELETQLVQVSV